MYRYLLLTLLSLLTFSCADSSTEIGKTIQKIVGGEPALHEDYPSIVGLTRETGGAFCTGTLVRPDLIITASHCILQSNITKDTLFVVHGYETPRLATSYNRHDIYEIVNYPDYDFEKSFDDDIAIIILNNPIATPACAPILHSDNFEDLLNAGDRVKIAGYGRVDAEESGGVLFAADTLVVRRFTKEIVIGGTNNPNICYGDSGGPIYVELNDIQYVTGVASRMSAPVCRNEATHVLPGAYIEWIQSSYNSVIAKRDGTDSNYDLSTYDCPLVGDPIPNPENDDIGCSISNSNYSNVWVVFLILSALFYVRKNKKVKSNVIRHSI